MINTGKTGVKTWSDANRDVIQKPESEKNLSAQDQAKFGDQNVGDVLNKISDPNWIDPTKKMRTVGNDKLDKDAFLKLMIAQMKHQDPTNPLKSHEMAAQLASFTSVEQMSNINSTLQEMKNGQKPMENFQVLSLIGKSVSGDSAKVSRMKGDKEHDFQYALPDDAAEVTIKVKDPSGETARVYELRDIKKGENKLTWNGQDERGTDLPEGDYQFVVEAKTATGKKLSVKSDFDGMITGVNYSPEGPVLLIGNQTVKMKDVRKIIDPSLKKNDQNVENQVSQDLKNQVETQQNSSKSSDTKPEAKIMSSVGMARGLMNKVSGQVKPETPNAESTAQPEAKPTAVRK